MQRDREEATRKNAEGLTLLQAGDYEEALKLFDEATSIDHTYAAARLKRADANRKLVR